LYWMLNSSIRMRGADVEGIWKKSSAIETPAAPEIKQNNIG
jgi:hypothetical protein